MARDRGPAETLDQWAECYRRLLRISQEQSALMPGEAGDEPFADRFAALDAEWRAVQEQIMQLEARLIRAIGEDAFKQQFSSRIAPIARDIQKTIEQTAARMKADISRAGASLRTFRERRQLQEAYSDYEQASDQAIFFDEKK